MWNKEEELLKVYYTKQCILQYKNARLDDEYFREKFFELCICIRYVLNLWSGQTWIGRKKELDISNSFQSFFVALSDLIMFFEENKNKMSIDERYFSKFVAYRGTVYRYLGNGSPNCRTLVVPEYDDIYVSWSKESQNTYIESKLYGTITWLSAEIKPPNFGIDFEGFEKLYYRFTYEKCRVSRGAEREVVFPTIKQCITEVKYIEDDYEEQEDDQN